STICVKTSGDTRQSLNSSARRCAHAGVIFSPPHLGLSIGHTGWRRLIQQEVTGCNEGQKMRDSKFMVCVLNYIEASTELKRHLCLLDTREVHSGMRFHAL